MRCCLLLVCLLVRCFPVTGPSLMRLLVRLSLVCCWSVTGLLLVCHWSVTGLLLVCSGHGRWSGSLIVHPSCIPRASLVHRSCVARASLVCLFLFLLVCCSSVVGHGRCSACCSPVAPPACLSVGPSLSCHSSVCWPVAAGPSLMYRWSVCLSITGCRCPVPVQGHRSIAHPSARASARASFIHRSSICSSVCSCIAHPSLIHLLVRLFESGLLVAGPSLLSLTSLSRVSHESLTGLSVRSSLVCLLVQLLGSWSLPRGWSATRLSPIRRWSWPLVHLLVRRALLCPLLCPLLSCLLFCHQSVCSGHGRWLAHPLVVCCSCVIGHGRRSATHAPLVCLLVFPAARLPVALPLVRRCSACWSVCWCVAGLSVGASLVCLLVRRWSVCWCVAGLSVGASLVHLLVHHWSICSCITGLSATLPLVCLLVRRSSICSGHVTRASDHPSGRASLVAYSSPLVCWSFCSGHGRCFVARPSARLSLARPSARLSLARLLESWSRVLPLVCLLACHSSIRSGHVTRASARVVVARASDRVVATGLLVRGWSAVRASLAMVVDLSLVHRSCVCSTRRWCVVGVLLMCN